MKLLVASLALFLFFFLVAWNNATSSSSSTLETSPGEMALSSPAALSSLPLFDENSITRDYLNKLSGLKWKNKFIDWVDLNGTPQGRVPWASADVNRRTQGPITLDITKLALAQQGKKDQLLVLSATLAVKIWSRESTQSPVLSITLQDGSLHELTPTLDCSVSTSTSKNINADTLSFNNGGERSFVQFRIPDKEFKSAILKLWPKKIYGSGQIHIFNLASQNSKFEFKPGIASELPSFAALKDHSAVIFMDLFDSKSKIKSEWFMQSKLSSEQIDNGFLTGAIDPKRRHKRHSAINIRYFFAKHAKEEPTEVYFRYSVRFHKNFIHATQGGKLPGQAGTYNRCGWGGRKPSKNCQGWSARMIWSLPVKTGAYKGLIPVGTYLYYLGQPGTYGDHERWRAFCKMGQWCELEQYVKLNTPGKADGILRGYHNGALVYERKDIRYRDSYAVRIEDAWTLIYHGGTASPAKLISADIDNVVIANSYIGIPKNMVAATQRNK